MDVLSFITPKARTFYIEEDATVRQAVEKFDFHKFSVVPIIGKNGEYVSTLSEGDILRYIKNEADFDISAAEHVRVTEIEKYRPYKALDLRAETEEIVRLSLEQNFIPIVDDRGAYMGIVKRKAIIDYLFSNSVLTEDR